jgi:hypothetical protein
MKPSRLRQPGFWSAIAGMALAIALACGIVATEMIGLYGSRATHFRHKMDRLQARISQMQARLASANSQVAEMQREAAYHDEFERIFAASDSQLIRLEPHDRRADIAGALVLSRRLAAAALEVVGLPAPSPGEHYAVSWAPREGPPIFASQLDPVDPKAGDAVLKLPFPPPAAVGVMVALEAARKGNRVVALPVLKGEIRRIGPRSR